MKNLANYISVSRIIASILLIVAEPFLSCHFFVIYLYCGLSDMLDGFFARKYNTESKLGEKIDSLADIVFVMAAMIKIIPNLNLPKEIFVWIIIITAVKFFGFIYNLICYKRIIFLHTTANKITGFAIFITPILLLVMHSSLIFYIFLCSLAFFASIQEEYYVIRGR